jgi:hypothetical protein
MGILLNARPVRQLSTSSNKISKHFASYLLASMIRRAKRAVSNLPAPIKLVSILLTKCLLIELYLFSIPSNLPAPIKLVSILLTKCLLIEQGEYDEHEEMFLLAVCQVSGRQVPTP